MCITSVCKPSTTSGTDQTDREQAESAGGGNDHKAARTDGLIVGGERKVELSAHVKHGNADGCEAANGEGLSST